MPPPSVRKVSSQNGSGPGLRSSEESYSPSSPGAKKATPASPAAARRASHEKRIAERKSVEKKKTEPEKKVPFWRRGLGRGNKQPRGGATAATASSSSRNAARGVSRDRAASSPRPGRNGASEPRPEPRGGSERRSSESITEANINAANSVRRIGMVASTRTKVEAAKQKRKERKDAIDNLEKKRKARADALKKAKLIQVIAVEDEMADAYNDKYTFQVIDENNLDTTDALVPNEKDENTIQLSDNFGHYTMEVTNEKPKSKKPILGSNRKQPIVKKMKKDVNIKLKVSSSTSTLYPPQPPSPLKKKQRSRKSSSDDISVRNDFNTKGQIYGTFSGSLDHLSESISAFIGSGSVHCIIGQNNYHHDGKSGSGSGTGGCHDEGWIWMTNEGEVGGIEGMIIHWKVTSFVQMEDKNRKNDWAIDMTFPSFLSLDPIPALMHFDEINHKIEIVFPNSNQMKQRPTSFNGQNNQLLPILSLTKINDLSSFANNKNKKKELKLGTSLKHVAMNVIKEIKKLCIGVLVISSQDVSKNNKKLNKKSISEKDVTNKIVIKMWNIKMIATVDGDPFWMLMKLRIGISKICANIPPLLPGGEMSEPVYLAQACEDEKDGRLKERLNDSLEELTNKFGEINFQHSDVSLQDLIESSQDDIKWSMGYSGSGSDPISAYLLLNPLTSSFNTSYIVKFRNRWLEKHIRPMHMNDLNKTIIHMKNGVLPDDDDNEEDLGNYAVKGTRGKLIMAAERNKKALEDGTYGKSSNQSYDTGPSSLLGSGEVMASAPEDATVVQVRLLKLNMGDGLTLCDTKVSRAEAEAAEVMERRNARLKVSSKNQLGEMRKNRLQIKINSKLERFSADNTFSSGTISTTRAVNFIKLNEIRDGHNKLYQRNLQELKNTNNNNKDNDDMMVRQGLLLINKELLVNKEKMINGRKRRILDFLHLSNKKKLLSSNDGDQDTMNDILDKPINSSSQNTLSIQKKKEMTDEEKEMLMILKNINTSNQSKFENKSDNNSNDEDEEDIIVPRKKIRDISKTKEIAEMRMEVIMKTLKEQS